MIDYSIKYMAYVHRLEEELTNMCAILYRVLGCIDNSKRIKIQTDLLSIVNRLPVELKEYGKYPKDIQQLIDKINSETEESILVKRPIRTPI